MEEHRVRQARIVDALEEEKKKISKELEEMQKKRAFRENQTPRHGESQKHYSLSSRDLTIQVFILLGLFITGPP